MYTRFLKFSKLAMYVLLLSCWLYSWLIFGSRYHLYCYSYHFEHQSDRLELQRLNESLPLIELSNTTNRQLSWCPRATCNNSPLCHPCKQRFLFIISTGRAASTTLLRMLNLLPKVRLSGENHNELFVASQLESNLRKGWGFGTLLRNSPTKAIKGGAWMHNEVPAQAMACPIQSVLSTINPPPRKVLQIIGQPGQPSLKEYEESMIIGAKMIRIQTGNWSASDAASFFRWNFPCARYIVNIRANVDEQAESQEKYFRKGDHSKVMDRLRKENDFLEEFSRNLQRDTAVFIKMEEWTQNDTFFNEIIAWMGFTGCHFSNFFHENANGFTRGKSNVHLGPECHLP